MKKLMIIAGIFLPFMMVHGCIKPKVPPKYTISGTILLGYDQRVPPPLYSWKVEVRNDVGLNGKSEMLGSFNPDNQGNFTFKYDKTSITGSSARISLYTEGPAYYQIDNLQVNTDIVDTFLIHGPIKGMVRIYLKPLKPLIKDTLFLTYGPLYPKDEETIIDTILETVDGLYLNTEFFASGANFGWGRGSQEFLYNAQEDRFTILKNRAYFSVTGDPEVTEVTIEY